jgi:hypothetical protein
VHHVHRADEADHTGADHTGAGASAAAPVIHILDESFVVAGAARLRADWCDERVWARLLPGTTLECYEDRGLRGKRWRLHGRLRGTAEVWLQPLPTGVLVHVYVRADPAASLRAGAVRRLHARTARDLKRFGFQVKDAAEGARRPGEGSVAQQTGDDGDERRWPTRPPATS